MTWRTVVRNPYGSVNFASARQRKAQMHSHTTNSDGSRPPFEVIDIHKSWRYHILAITDHDYDKETTDIAGRQEDIRQPTWPWTDYGRDPAKVGLFPVKGLEPSNADHFVQLWGDFWTEDDLTVETVPGDPDSTLYRINRKNLPWMLAETRDRGALAEMAHPGRYDRTDEFYRDLFESYNHLHGFEIFNRDNRYPEDLPRWDRVLQLLRDAGTNLPAWGWAVDDHHFPSELGESYMTLLIDTTDEPTIRGALETGAFFSTHDPVGNDIFRHVDAPRRRFWTAAPIIDRVAVTDWRISLKVRQEAFVQWVSNGVVVHTGTSLPLDTAGLGGYVRAEAWGDQDARTLTQPFYLEAGTDPGPEPSGSGEPPTSTLSVGGTTYNVVGTAGGS